MYTLLLEFYSSAVVVLSAARTKNPTNVVVVVVVVPPIPGPSCFFPHLFFLLSSIHPILSKVHMPCRPPDAMYEPAVGKQTKEKKKKKKTERERERMMP
ncbi:hypothetical protein HDK64DRAFT_271817, partial [Phyllosticta capitalensis]